MRSRSSSGPRKHCRTERRTCFMLYGELVVEIDGLRRKKRRWLTAVRDRTRLVLRIHRMTTLPAVCVFVFDHCAAVSAGSGDRLFFLRGWRWRWLLACGNGRRWRLDHRRYRFRLGLFLDHVQKTGSYQCPTLSSAVHKGRLNDLNLARIGIGAVIVVLVVL